LGNSLNNQPEFVIPAKAGIQAMEFNDRTAGCPPSRA
jgi:hypothetical protein